MGDFWNFNPSWSPMCSLKDVSLRQHVCKWDETWCFTLRYLNWFVGYSIIELSIHFNLGLESRDSLVPFHPGNGFHPENMLGTDTALTGIVLGHSSSYSTHTHKFHPLFNQKCFVFFIKTSPKLPKEKNTSLVNGPPPFLEGIYTPGI